MSSWYRQLFGVEEAPDFARAQANFRFCRQSGVLTSLANGESFVTGSFTTPTLESLRAAGRAAIAAASDDGAASTTTNTTTTCFIKYRHAAQGDVLLEHAKYPGALFQAASQFNCLEFPSARGVPEDGVTKYAYDSTQGPACSLACAAGTVVRNYFAEAGSADDAAAAAPPPGQRADRQLNNLDLLEAALQNDREQYFAVRNGYVFAKRPRDLARLSEAIRASKSSGDYEGLKGLLKIGLHRDVGVTFASRYEPPAVTGATVSQAYCSALSCAYSGIDIDHWEPFARLVLEAAYEATLWAAVINAAASGGGGGGNHRNKVFLTFLGGGVFGNDPRWICDSIGRAMAVVALARRGAVPIEVTIAHYRRVDPEIARWIDAAFDREIAQKGQGGKY